MEGLLTAIKVELFTFITAKTREGNRLHLKKGHVRRRTRNKMEFHNFMVIDSKIIPSEEF